MIKSIILLAVVTFVTAKPSYGIFEKEITKILREKLAPEDPLSIASVPDVNVTVDDTSLLFDFTNAVISGFAQVECTHFTPPLITKHTEMKLYIESTCHKAELYTATGTLNGNPFEATGSADLDVFDGTYDIQFKAESHKLEPFSLCIEPGTLKIDLSISRLEANFENADELNEELNTRGPELVELLQDDIMSHADEIVNLLNELLCQP